MPLSHPGEGLMCGSGASLMCGRAWAHLRGGKAQCSHSPPQCCSQRQRDPPADPAQAPTLAWVLQGADWLIYTPLTTQWGGMSSAAQEELLQPRKLHNPPGEDPGFGHKEPWSLQSSPVVRDFSSSALWGSERRHQ